MTETQPQVGEYWRMREGDRVVGPLVGTNDGGYALYEQVTGWTFALDGRYDKKSSPGPRDLVSRVHLLTDAEYAEWQRLKAAQPTPEVIEGRGQEVTESQYGAYVCEKDGEPVTLGYVARVYRMTEGSQFQAGHRYMRCPAFPPAPPPFVAPPKPELVLVKPTPDNVDDYPEPFWAVRTGDGFYTHVDTGEHSEVSRVMELDPATGKPIGEEGQ